MKHQFDTFTKKYFWFLVMEYGFSFEDNVFTSDELEISITPEWKRPDFCYPEISFKLAREADCPVLPFDWILYYLNDAQPDIHVKASLEENMQYFSDLLQRYSQRLFLDAGTWWIPAHKYRLKIWENLFETDHVVSFQSVYDYISAKEGK